MPDTPVPTRGFKATRPDGTSFHDSTTTWRVGRITRVPQPLGTALCGPGILHFSDAPGETLVGGLWPCRLFEVEVRGAVVASEGHKHGAHGLKVVRELPAWQALGPNGEAVVALIERAKTLTTGQATALNAAWNAAWYVAWDAARNAARDAARYAAWYAAWNAARDAARNAARDAARDAAWYAAWNAARDAAWNGARDAAWNVACALVVRDLITPDQFDALAGPGESVMGALDAE